MKKITLLISIILLISLVLIGGNCKHEKETEEYREKTITNPASNVCYKITINTEKNYCLAVVNQDISFCDNLDQLDQKKLCQAMAARDVSYCRKIQNPGPKKMCYYELSFLTGEFDYCDEMENPNDCYFAFIHRLHWESRHDEIKGEYCERINHNTPEGQVFKNCCWAFRKQDSSLCQGNKFCLSFFKQPLSFCNAEFKTPEGTFKYRDDCLIDRAMSEKDSSLCAEIKEEELRDLCYGNFSTHISPDISLCEKIADTMKRDMCYVEVAISLSVEQ